MRSVFLAVCLLASTAQATENLGGGGAYGLVEGGLGTSGGTMTGPICWYDTSSSVCIDSTSPGTLKTYGSGATNNEDLTCDYETTADEITCSSSTGVTQIEYTSIDLNPATVTVGTGGQWKAGTADSMICLQEVDTATDQVCLTTINDNISFYQGDSSTFAAMFGGGVTAEAAAPVMTLRDSTSPGDATGTGTMRFQAYDDAGTPNLRDMANVVLDVTDATSTSEDADIVFSVMSGGSLTEMLRLDGDGGETIATGRLVSKADLGGQLNLIDTTGTGDVNGSGSVRFYANNLAGGLEKYAQVEMDVTDVTAGVEQADLVLYALSNGASTEMMRLDGSAGGITLNGNSAVLLGGVSDNSLILRESDSPTDDVCLFTNGDELWVRGGDCGAATAVQASTLRASDPTDAHLVVNDGTGVGTTGAFAEVNFQANDSGTATHDMVTLKLEVTDATAGAEYADLVFEATTNGTDATEYLRIDSSAGGVSMPATKKLFFDGDGDLDTFIYEHSEDTVRLYLGNTASMWLTTVGHSFYHSTGRTSSRYSLAASENPGAMEVYRYDLSPTNGDVVGNIYFKAADAVPANADYANIQGSIVDTTAGVEDGKLCLQADHNGTLTDELCVQGGANEGTYIPATKKLFFDGGGDLDTFIQESSEDNLQIVVGNTAKQVMTETTYSIRTGSSGILSIIPTSNSLNVPVAIQTQRIDTSPTNNDVLTQWQIQGKNSTPATVDFVTVIGTAEEVTASDEDGSLEIQVMNDGTTATTAIKCDMSDTVEDCTFSVPIGNTAIGGDTKGAKTIQGGAFEDLTCSASASLTTSGLIPDGAFLIGVTTRVTTALTGAVASFTVGEGTGGTPDVDLWGADNGITQGSTTDNSDATANWSNPMLAAEEVKITFNDTCTAGVIRVVAHYFTVSAPSSN